MLAFGHVFQAKLLHSLILSAKLGIVRHSAAIFLRDEENNLRWIGKTLEFNCFHLEVLGLTDLEVGRFLLLGEIKDEVPFVFLDVQRGCFRVIVQVRVRKIVREEGQIIRAFNDRIVHGIQVHLAVIQVTASELRACYVHIAVLAVPHEYRRLDWSNEESATLTPVNCNLNIKQKLSKTE